MKSVQNKIWILIIGFAVSVAACVESYTLEGVDTSPDFLVVDAFIDASSQRATAKLTRALGLNEDDQYPVITDARVSIESESGEEFLLYQLDGTYLSYDLPVDMAKKYKLKIALKNGSGKKYESEWVTIEQAAKIESVRWDIFGDNVRILVNTSESEGNSRYYRWRYTEVFEYNAPLFSQYYLNNDREMTFRTTGEDIYICYREDPSHEILIGSAENLGSNVIRNYPLRFLPKGSIKLSRLYSINVRQYGLTEDAYTYWLNLYKTTESTGGLFDPMPGQVFGNIRAVSDPDEKVIGFFSASTVEEKRIFIDRLELPREFASITQPYCQVDTVLNQNIQFYAPGTPFYTSIYDEMGLMIIGYTYSALTCLDCRPYGRGTLYKPDFWPR